MTAFNADRSFKLEGLNIFQKLVMLYGNVGTGRAVHFSSPPPIGLGERLERDLASIFRDLELIRRDEGFPSYCRHGDDTELH